MLIAQNSHILISSYATIASSDSLNSLINRLEKGDLVEKDILVRNMVSNLEIDAQKMVIYRYKSPFNFIFEPEFSTGSPVGDPIGTVIEPPETVARVLYTLATNYDYSIPEIPPEVIKEASRNIDYIL